MDLESTCSAIMDAVHRVRERNPGAMAAHLARQHGFDLFVRQTADLERIRREYEAIRDRMKRR